MSYPTGEDLMGLVVPYALHALSDDDAAAVEQGLAASAPDVVELFRTEVRDVLEAMAVVSAATAAEPPDRLRQQLLDTVAADNVRALPSPDQRQPRWRRIAMAAAAVVVLGVGGVGAWSVLRPAPPIAEQVLAATDMRTSQDEVPGGGAATIVFSREVNAAVLTMTDVAPPTPGTVYQMWLVPENGVPVSAGTMGPDSVTPITTAVIEGIDNYTALTFTVEPGDGSSQPTGAEFSPLSLT